MKKFLLFIAALSFLFFPLSDSGAKVAGVFTTTSVQQVQVTASSVSMRTGASASHRVIKDLPRGTVIDVIGKIGNYYVVKNSKDTVGCVYGTYVKPYVRTTTTTGTDSNPVPAPVPGPTPTPAPTPVPADTASAMQAEMLGYINAARSSAGVAPLALSQALSGGAFLKSKDMAENDYFSHTSPTYGSPFAMMQSLGITYRLAGENIAQNSSVKGAFDAFMNSTGHRENMLNSGYSQIGLGFYQEGYYLYVTQWFTD
jgi:uncharacterized protein YkwD